MTIHIAEGGDFHFGSSFLFLTVRAGNLINVAVSRAWSGEEGRRKSSCATFSSVHYIKSAVDLEYAKFFKFYNPVI